jgi:two-component system, cell cycle sensor histidine kinase and response regulator CckA
LPGHGETLLVVEDETAIRKLTQHMLEDLGYIVLNAESAKKALEMSETHGHEIRLVITDVIMPEMNGRELADRLKALNPDLGILFMSGYTADVISHLGILDPGVCFIEKPFSVASLADKVHEVLAKNSAAV